MIFIINRSEWLDFMTSEKSDFKFDGNIERHMCFEYEREDTSI